MRRTTAAAVGTVTGAALIMAVRLSAFSQPLAAPPPTFDLEAESGTAPTAGPSASARGRDREADDSGDGDDDSGSGAGSSGGLTDGRYAGKAITNPYGTVQVAITVSDGRVTSAAASYPTAGNSATINPPAVAKLKRETLAKQSADLDTVSGATYTSDSYVKSLQAALDAAGA